MIVNPMLCFPLDGKSIIDTLGSSMRGEMF